MGPHDRQPEIAFIRLDADDGVNEITNRLQHYVNDGWRVVSHTHDQDWVTVVLERAR